MEKSARLSILILCLFAFFACSRQTALPDLSQIAWIESLGYTSDEVIPLLVSGSVPGPRVSLSVNGQSRYVLLDLFGYDLLLADNAFGAVNFEPQRLANLQMGYTKLLVEEGFLHDVRLLNEDYDILYASVIKRAEPALASDGWLGKSFLMNGRVTIDVGNKILAYTENLRPLNELLPADQLIDIHIRKGYSQKPGLIKCYGKVRQDSVCLTLSTQVFATQISPELVSQLGGSSARNTYTLDTLQIGSLYFTELNCQIHPDQLSIEPENPEPIQLTVGMEILRQQLLTIDFPAQQLVLH